MDEQLNWYNEQLPLDAFTQALYATNPNNAQVQQMVMNNMLQAMQAQQQQKAQAEQMRQYQQMLGGGYGGGYGTQQPQYETSATGTDIVYDPASGVYREVGQQQGGLGGVSQQQPQTQGQVYYDRASGNYIQVPEQYGQDTGNQGSGLMNLLGRGAAIEGRGARGVWDRFSGGIQQATDPQSSFGEKLGGGLKAGTPLVGLYQGLGKGIFGENQQ